LFDKAARESKEVAMILTDVFDSADAKQRVNEKLPSPTTSTFFEYNFGSSKAMMKRAKMTPQMGLFWGAPQNF